MYMYIYVYAYGNYWTRRRTQNTGGVAGFTPRKWDLGRSAVWHESSFYLTVCLVNAVT